MLEEMLDAADSVSKFCWNACTEDMERLRILVIVTDVSKKRQKLVTWKPFMGPDSNGVQSATGTPLVDENQQHFRSFNQ